MDDVLGQLRGNAYGAQQKAGDYASAAKSIPDELKRIVQEALDYNKDIIGLRASAFSDYGAAPAMAGERFGVQTFSQGERAGQANPDFVFNPLERNASIADFIRSEEIPFNVYNALLGQREGTTADTVKAGTAAFEAQSTAAQRAAELASNVYQDALKEFTTREQLRQGDEQLDINRISANKSGGGKEINPLDVIEGKGALVSGIKQQLDLIKAKGPVSQKTIDSLLQQAYPDLQRLGVKDTEIKSLKNALISDYVMPVSSGGSSKPLVGANSLIGRLTNPETPKKGGLVGAYSPQISSYLQRGLSNVANFMQGK